jgi:uncharacterized integral membrane protein
MSPVADRDATQRRERRVPPALIGAVVFALVVLVFVLQNTHRVPIHFLWFEWDAQLWLMLLITCASAIAAAELFSVYLRRRRGDNS